jgi:hypothetical protein
MALRAIKKSCRCCQFPCTSDTFFEEGNIPTIITSEYEDQCGCRNCCSYPNNVYTILLVQFMTIVAYASTLVAAASCRFVNGPADVVDAFSIRFLFNNSIPGDVTNNNATTRGVGFFAWEVIDGKCAYQYYPTSYNSTVPGEEIYVDTGVFDWYYTNLVGTNWETPRNMTGITFLLSSVVLIWVFSLSCVAHKRRYRAILSFFLAVLLPLFQSLSLLVFRTKFCQDNDCQLSDGSKNAIGSTIFYSFAGIILWVGTSNFPGNPYAKGRRTPRCINLLCCRNTRRQMDEEEDPEQIEMVATASRLHQHVDVVEVPVESEYFDTALIDGTAVPTTPAPVEISVASLTTPPEISAASLTTSPPMIDAVAAASNSKTL